MTENFIFMGLFDIFFDQNPSWSWKIQKIFKISKNFEKKIEKKFEKKNRKFLSKKNHKKNVNFWPKIWDLNSEEAPEFKNGVFVRFYEVGKKLSKVNISVHVPAEVPPNRYATHLTITITTMRSPPIFSNAVLHFFFQ